MSADEHAGLIEAASAIAAGRPVDWPAIESSEPMSESSAALLGELRIVEHIATLHRTLPGVLQPARALPVEQEPEVWGSLRLLEHVGHGVYGDVYRAWDPRLDREVALKLLKRAASSHHASGSVVIEEGRLLARVRHPNVVTVYGADRIDNRVGLWMEFVRGRTMQAVIHQHGPLGPQEAALIGLDVCRALSAVHHAGLVHRDVKAQNVVRESGGRIVLMDFGAGREQIEATPELTGTPLYLAPEVFGELPATVRSDIYSVGVLLFHLVTAAYPILGTTVADIREAHRARRRAWLRDRRPDLPDGFVRAVERALEFDPALRYESVGEFEGALARVLAAGDDAAKTPAAVPTAISSAASKTAWWRRPAAAAAAAIAVALLGLVAAPSSWWDRMLASGSGGSTARPGVSAAPIDPTSKAIHRVKLPANRRSGTPAADGRLISLTDWAGNVAVVDLTTGQPRTLTSDAVIGVTDSQYAETTAVSPDSRFVAYSWYALDGRYEIRLVDVEGGRPRVLVRDESIAYPLALEWSRDGRWILATSQAPDRSATLSLVSVDEGTIRLVRQLGSRLPGNASLSPDGEFVVYDAPPDASLPERDVFIIRADGSENRALVRSPSTDAHPIWTPDGRHVLFASDRSRTMDLWGIDVERGVAEGEPYIVHRNIGRFWINGFTDAGRFFFTQTVGGVDVYEAELTDTAVKNPVTIPTTSSGSNLSSVWSPDGRRVAFASRRGLINFDLGSTTLAILDRESREQREIVPALDNFLVSSWSADGRRILVQGRESTQGVGIFVIDVDTGRTEPVAVSRDPRVETTVERGDWMPDGRVLYVSQTKRALLARHLDTGADDTVLDFRAEGIEGIFGGGYRLFSDGDLLAFIGVLQAGGTATSSLRIKSLNGGPSRELLRSKPGEGIVLQAWLPDGQSLIYCRWHDRQLRALWRVSVHGGEPQPLGLALEGLRSVTVDPTGRRISFTAGWPLNELSMMENFLTGK